MNGPRQLETGPQSFDMLFIGARWIRKGLAMDPRGNAGFGGYLTCEPLPKWHEMVTPRAFGKKADASGRMWATAAWHGQQEQSDSSNCHWPERRAGAQAEGRRLRRSKPSSALPHAIVAPAWLSTPRHFES